MLNYLLAILAILLEWFSWLNTADDFKTIITGLAGLFGASKIWDFWQKRNDNATKVKEAEINAEKEIQNNKDRHNAEVERFKNTITHQAGEIQYKDALMLKMEVEIENLKKALEKEREEHKRNKLDLIKINEEKDRELRVMSERLLECEKSKNK